MTFPVTLLELYKQGENQFPLLFLFPLIKGGQGVVPLHFYFLILSSMF